MHFDLFVFYCVAITTSQILTVDGHGNYYQNHRRTDSQDLSKILEQFNNVNANNCRSMEFSKLHLDLNIDHTDFNNLTFLPLYMSNFYSRILKNDFINGSLDARNLPDFVFYNFARTVLITGLPSVYAIPIAFTRWVFSRHELFAPTAVIKNGHIVTVNEADSYDYTIIGSLGEWFTVHANKSFNHVKDLTINTKFGTPGSRTQPLVTSSEGQWVRPFYDCGKVNEWLFSYSTPILGSKTNGEHALLAAAAIDIRLSYLDINQCDGFKHRDVFFNAFQGTHKCPSFTMCLFKPGHGFKAGGYACVCKNGVQLSSTEVLKATSDGELWSSCHQRRYEGHNYHDHDHNYHNNNHATNYNYHRMGHTYNEYHWRHRIISYLDRLRSVNDKTCVTGTSVCLDIQMDYSRWERNTYLALFNANYMSTRIFEEEGALANSQEITFYVFAWKAALTGLPTSIGSTLAFKPNVIPNKKMFAPYAIYKNGAVDVYDLSPTYDYQQANWYTALVSKVWEKASSILTSTNINGTIQEGLKLYATPSDGHWTKPYFDCGRSNAWVITFSAPIFGQDKNNKPILEGVATTDVDLTNVDINQCDGNFDTNDPFKGAFRGTHKCPRHTKCVHKPGFGFKRGGYSCYCGNGFEIKGEIIEGNDPNVLAQEFDNCQPSRWHRRTPRYGMRHRGWKRMYRMGSRHRHRS